MRKVFRWRRDWNVWNKAQRRREEILDTWAEEKWARRH